MYKRFFIGLAIFGLLSVLFAACAIRDSSASVAGPTVKMSGADFIQKTVTVPKGQSLNLVDITTSPHKIFNGTWANGTTAKPSKESGAPTVSLNFNGNDSGATPPFTTAGTFQLYCSIHPGMNLAVTVK
ncbi:MAG: hypothetical protein M3Z24_01300 [Chloroflexota bacterium]|nr:hypothetical protein [Chloroflexota bacterium]